MLPTIRLPNLSRRQIPAAPFDNAQALGLTKCALASLEEKAGVVLTLLLSQHAASICTKRRGSTNLHCALVHTVHFVQKLLYRQDHERMFTCPTHVMSQAKTLDLRCPHRISVHDVHLDLRMRELPGFNLQENDRPNARAMKLGVDYNLPWTR